MLLQHKLTVNWYRKKLSLWAENLLVNIAMIDDGQWPDMLLNTLLVWSSKADPI